MTDPTRHPDEPDATEAPEAPAATPDDATTGPGVDDRHAADAGDVDEATQAAEADQVDGSGRSAEAGGDPIDDEPAQADSAAEAPSDDRSTDTESAPERDARPDLRTEDVDAAPGDDAAPEDDRTDDGTAAEAVTSEKDERPPTGADPVEAWVSAREDATTALVPETSTAVDEARPTTDDKAEAPDALEAPGESGESDESGDAPAPDRVDLEPQPVPAEPLLLSQRDPLERPGSIGSEDYRDAAAAEQGRGPVEGKAAWRRMLLMGRPRATRANLLGALLAVLLGAGIAAQVQLTNERGLDELSQSDLVRVLDDVSVRSSRLDQQVRELESTRDRLKNGTGTAAEALAQAQKRIDTLGILAGSVGVKGPGIVMTISDPDNQVTGPLILDMIQELRDAGAESIDVGGVRVVASSFVGDADGDILIDGKAISRPIVVKAIGDSNTLSSAMTIPGGIVETVRQKNAEAAVTESENVQITSIHEPTTLTYAKPVE